MVCPCPLASCLFSRLGRVAELFLRHLADKHPKLWMRTELVFCVWSAWFDSCWESLRLMAAIAQWRSSCGIHAAREYQITHAGANGFYTNCVNLIIHFCPPQAKSRVREVYLGVKRNFSSFNSYFTNKTTEVNWCKEPRMKEIVVLNFCGIYFASCDVKIL